MKKIFLIIFLLMPGLPVKANEFVNKNLLNLCDSKAKSASRRFCEGYLNGALGQRGFVSVVALKINPDFKDYKSSDEFVSRLYGCVDGKSIDQLVAVYIKWAKVNPEEWQEDPSLGVLKAMALAFPAPCD